jgi:hypothetical protein
MTTFEEARQIVIKSLNDSSLYVPEWGYENDEWWNVMAGDKRWLADGDETYLPIDDTLRVVNKTTGEFQIRSIVEDLNFFESFTLYGNVPEAFQ